MASKRKFCEALLFPTIDSNDCLRAAKIHKAFCGDPCEGVNIFVPNIHGVSVRMTLK